MSNSSETYQDVLKPWISRQASPFTLDEALRYLGGNPERLTRDLTTKLATELRLAGAVKVIYRAPGSTTFNLVRWASASVAEAPQDSWRIAPPPAPSALDEFRADREEKYRIRLAIARGLLPIGSDEPLAAGKAPVPTRPTLPRRLAQWLVAVAQWFRSFPSLR